LAKTQGIKQKKKKKSADPEKKNGRESKCKSAVLQAIQLYKANARSRYFQKETRLRTEKVREGRRVANPKGEDHLERK